MENDQTRPNLFSYATSELSQDAFICWLAAWSDPKFNDSDLHQTACKFIASLIYKHKPNYDIARIRTVTVRRQVEKLDILIEINEGDDEEKLAILIEDKTHTDHHSGQLDRYYSNMLKDYAEKQIVPIYFKTGYQSKFDVGRYQIYLRKDFLQLLRQGSVANNIYQDFLAHLERMEYVVNQYEKIRLLNEAGKSAWSDNDWRGFFMRLYTNRGQFYAIDQNDGANWNYIANPAGGFFGFWWYFKPLQSQLYRPYLQLENNSLCFKIEVHDETKRSLAREEAYQKLIETTHQLDIAPVKRPERMGNGKYMTVLRWNGDYRAQKDGLLDFENTLENLRKAQQILDTAFPQ